MLENDDPLWDQHSGGSGHSGAEWCGADGALAKEFYADLPEKARFVFDLLVERPGERLDADWIAAQLSIMDDSGPGNPSRQSVSSILGPVSQLSARSGRRFPFYWWRQNGGASRYAMKPLVAQLFREARHSIVDAHAAAEAEAYYHYGVQILDASGKPLNATFSAEPEGDWVALIMESRSGRATGRPGRNADYNPALTLLLERLARLDVTLVDALVDSRKTRALGIAEKERRLLTEPVRYGSCRS